MIHGNETILIKRRIESNVDDDYGLPEWTEELISIDGALIAWGSTSTDYGVDRVLINSAISLYLPEGVEVQTGDVFVVRGEQYKTDGEVQNWKAPLGFSIPTRVVVNLKKVEG